MNDLVSADLFNAFLNCKHKAHLTIRGKSGEPSDFDALQRRSLLDYQYVAEQHLLQSYVGTDVCQSPDSLSEAMKHGYALITACEATVDGFEAHFDAILRAAPRSASAQPVYAPVLFRPTEKLSRLDAMLLAYHGMLLGILQGNDVRFGTIVHGRRHSRSRVSLPKLLPLVQKILREIAALRGGGAVPPLRINAHCSVCEFRNSCQAVAVEKDDLSLLRGLKEKDIATLNSKGILTLTQFSYTFRPRRRRKTIAKPDIRHQHALQALALRTNTIYVACRPSLPTRRTRLFLDVEGIPDRDFHYLIGLLVCNEGRAHHALWADSEDDESTVWSAFLSLVATLEDFTLYSYGSYEAKWLKKMQRRYGGDTDLIRSLQSASCNVLSVIYGQIYFPTRANDLKTLASHLGFTWSQPGASGLQSIVWRHDWEARHTPLVKDILVQYNAEDCLALERVTQALEQISTNGESSTALPSTVVNTDDLRPTHPHRFGRNPFFSPELARINQCAYFDYQRERVYVRTSAPIKRAIRRIHRKRSIRYRINKEVECGAPERCPFCKATHVIRHNRICRRVFDLRLTTSGIKRWVVQYRAHRFLCRQCGKTFVPPSVGEAAHGHYGHTLLAWSVYHNIALRQSHGMIDEEIGELFGYSHSGSLASYLKGIASVYYEKTYRRLLDTIRTSRVVHADETKASIKGRTGYVWAFTTLDTVAYVYASTREGDILQTVLDGFEGVLVSDFYTAYDSVPCVQQKCLIHLMRDINDDLFKNPFNTELKELAREFTATLGPIVETIDEYGLKRAHLQKHKPNAQRFVRNVSVRDIVSEIAKGYQKRIAKNHDKLFAFLDYDGVPWNNNNAEHAIKKFAFLRRMIDGSWTEHGIRQYLVLLSICETLKLRNVSVLRFLMSGVQDLDQFADQCR